MLRYAFLCLFTSLVLAPLSQTEAASLSFKNKTMEVTAKPGTKQLTMVFPFENKSRETIEITKQAAACTCLGATFKDDKKHTAPAKRAS